MATLEELLRKTTLPVATSQSPTSLLSQVGEAGLGAVASLGNFLDLPGSVVRDIAGGEPVSNWFDQLASPLSAENRLSGRDVLTRWGLTSANKETGMSGWLSDPMEGVADLAGFGAELALDPFGPLTGWLARGTRFARPVRTAANASRTQQLDVARAAAESPSRAHPVMRAIGSGLQAAFDPLSQGGMQTIRRAFGGVQRQATALFDRFGWGVTHPDVQPIVQAARQDWRTAMDRVQSQAAMLLLESRDLGFRLDLDGTLDRADPTNWFAEGSPLRVAANNDAIRRYLGELDPTVDPAVRPTLPAFTKGDLVRLEGDPAGRLREVEVADTYQDGLRIRLVGDADWRLESDIVPVFRQTEVSVPEELRPSLDRFRTAMDQSRAELTQLGFNIPEWFDQFQAFFPRQKGDTSRYAEAVLQRSWNAWKRTYRGVVEATYNPGQREQMLGGFREGDAGINRLYGDQMWDEVYNRIQQHVSPVLLTVPGEPLQMPYLPNFVGVRHVAPIAQAIGLEPEDLWRQMVTSLSSTHQEMPMRLVDDPTQPGQLLLRDFVTPGAPVNAAANLRVSFPDPGAGGTVPNIPGMPNLQVDVGPFSEASVLLEDTVLSEVSPVSQFLNPLPNTDPRYRTPVEAFAEDIVEGRLPMDTDPAFSQYETFRQANGPAIDEAVTRVQARRRRVVENLISEMRPIAETFGANTLRAFINPQQADFWRANGFHPVRQVPGGHEEWSRLLHANRPGAAADMRYPQYIPLADAQTALARVRAQTVQAAANGTGPGIHAGTGNWRTFHNLLDDSGVRIRVQPHPTMSNTFVPQFSARIAAGLMQGNATYLELTAQNWPAWQRDPTLAPLLNTQAVDRIEAAIQAGNRLYLGLRQPTRGAAVVPVIVQPTITSQLDARFGRYAAMLDVDPARWAAGQAQMPLLQHEAAAADIHQTIARNYGEVITQPMAMPANDGSGVLAVAADGSLRDANRGGISRSVPEWHRTYDRLLTLYNRAVAASAQANAVPQGIDLGNSAVHALLRMDDQSLQALGFDDAQRQMLDTMRQFENQYRAGVSPLTQNPLSELEADVTVAQGDRYEALADELVEHSDRRFTQMFTNNPLVDMADYTTKNRMLYAYADRFVEAVTNLRRQVAASPAGAVVSGYLPSDTSRSNIPLGDLLDPRSEHSVFGTRLVQNTFADQIAARWERQGLLRRPTAQVGTGVNTLSPEELMRQEVFGLGVPAEVAAQLKTYGELAVAPTLPELTDPLKLISNLTLATKSGLLWSLSTAIRDGVSSLFNAAVMGDVNPLTAVGRFGRPALSFARGAPIDFDALGIPVPPEIDALLRTTGVAGASAAEINRQRGRALQALWAAHHRAPSRHANIVVADQASRANSGQAEAVLSGIPFSGIPQGGAAATSAPVTAAVATGAVNAAVMMRDLLSRPGALTPFSGNFAFSPLNVAGSWTRETARSTANVAAEAASTGQRFPGPPRDFGSSENRLVQRSEGNVFSETVNAFRANIDTTVRMSVVLEQLAKGRTLSEAFAETDRILTNSDPRNFSRFETQYLKTLIPFYSFMRQSIPMFLREFAQNPGGPLGMSVRAARLGQGDEDGYVPFQLQDTVAIPLGNANDGSLRYLTSLGLMHEDAVKYAGNAIQGDVRGLMQQVASSAHPAMKWWIEYATNTSLYSQGPMGGRRLDDLDPTLGRILANAGVVDVPPSGRPQPVGGPLLESLVAASPLSRAASTARVISNPSARSSATEKVMRLLLGTRVEAVSEEQIIRDIRDRVNALQIEYGARPLTTVSGTAELQKRLLESGATEDAVKLEQLGKVLAALRKQQRETEKAEKAQNAVPTRIDRLRELMQR